MSSNDQIIDGFLNGDSRAYKAIQRMIDAAFYTWQRRLSDEAEDIKAKATFALLCSLRDGKLRDKSKLPAYIRTVVKHVCTAHLRNWTRKKKIEDALAELPETYAMPDEELERQELARINSAALRQLPEECIRLWRMYLVDHMKYSEIASALRLNLNTVKGKFRTCLARLNWIRKKLLEGDQPL